VIAALLFRRNLEETWLDEFQEMCEGAAEEDVQIVRSAAASLQQHLVKIRELFSVVIRTKEAADDQSTVVSVAISGCPADAHVFSLNGKPDSLFAARLPDRVDAHATFYSPLFSLKVRDTIGPRRSRLSTMRFWSQKSPSLHARSFHFTYRFGRDGS
jgi:hypothetical protein